MPRSLILLPLAGCWLWQTPAPDPATWCDNTHHIACWLKIPAGSFTMGAQSADPNAPNYDPAASEDEGPVRVVKVDAFWILRHEVTSNDYGRCQQDGACQAADAKPDDQLATLGHPDKNFHPANTVSWHGAKRFCSWYGGRLPTEAEWEYAARGSDGRRFPWGDEPACGTARSRTAGEWTRDMDTAPCRNTGTLVVSDMRGTSPFDLVGMAGNVLEWVEDTYTPRGQDAPGSDLRVLKGGSWVDEDPNHLRVAARQALPPDIRLHDVGLRCVWTP